MQIFAYPSKKCTTISASVYGTIGRRRALTEIWNWDIFTACVHSNGQLHQPFHSSLAKGSLTFTLLLKCHFGSGALTRRHTPSLPLRHSSCLVSYSLRKKKKSWLNFTINSATLAILLITQKLDWIRCDAKQSCTQPILVKIRNSSNLSFYSWTLLAPLTLLYTTRNDLYSFLFNTSHVVLGDMQNHVWITRLAIQITQRPGWDNLYRCNNDIISALK